MLRFSHVSLLSFRCVTNQFVHLRYAISYVNSNICGYVLCVSFDSIWNIHDGCNLCIACLFFTLSSCVWCDASYDSFCYVRLLHTINFFCYVNFCVVALLFILLCYILLCYLSCCYVDFCYAC